MRKLAIKVMTYVLTLAILAGTVSVPVFAESEDDTVIVNTGVEAEVRDYGIEGWPQAPMVSADTAVVMELSSAVCQYNKGRDEIRYPAELTKYMVMLLAVENCDLEEEITFTETALAAVPEDAAVLGAQPGEVMTVEDCLYAISLISANDAVAQLVEYIGETEEKFIKMMNKRASQLGCDHTHFSNVTGLSNEDNYSSAYDMALVVRAGLRNKTLRKIASKTSYTIKKTNMSKKRKLFTSIPLMNEEDAGYYEACTAAKLYYAEEIGYNMVAAAKKEGVTYIVVTLGNEAPEDSYVDSRALLDYAHNNFVKSEYKIGKIVLPVTVSTDVIEVTGSTEDGEVKQRYYANDLLVGKGSKALYPGGLTEISVLEDVDMVYSEAELSDDDVVDMVVTVEEEELDYFTVFGLSMMMWELIGTLIVIIGALLILFGALIKKSGKKKKEREMRERRRRMQQYGEENS